AARGAVDPVDARGGVVEQGGPIGSGEAPGQALERVPEHVVRAARLVDGEVALGRKGIALGRALQHAVEHLPGFRRCLRDCSLWMVNTDDGTDDLVDEAGDRRPDPTASGEAAGGPIRG